MESSESESALHSHVDVLMKSGPFPMPMDDDGLWREHSFGVLREGVLETIVRKEKYFGLLLLGEAADGFAKTLSG